MKSGIASSPPFVPDVFNRRDRLEIKTPAQIEAMRRAGLVVASVLDLVVAQIAPGITTAELDQIAAAGIRAAGALPSFLGYHGFPACICVSVNDEVVHGIPGARTIEAGDLVSVDCGAIVAGWHGDAAVTVAVAATEADQALLLATEDALWAGLAVTQIGAKVSDIGAAVEASVRAAGPYGIVEEFVGHGIGTAMHLPPDVPNFGAPGRGPRLVAGLALAIEPMVTAGQRWVQVLEDEWTAVTADGSKAAHFEHTVAITEEGPWVLTAHDGGAARFAALSVPSPAARRA
ncbi:MAG: type I methionyl aminopeptidase [Actinomycetes bacterium]